MNICVRAFAVGLVFLVGGCNGGGDSLAPPPDGPITVTRLSHPTPGNSLAAQLKGTLKSGSDTVNATATINRSVGQPVTFNGENAIPVNSIITISVPSSGSGVILNGNSTTYFRNDGTIIGSTVSNGVTCTTGSSTAGPTQVEIGDSGPLLSSTCTDGSTRVLSFRVEAGDGTLNVVLVSSEQNGSDRSSELDTYRFTADNEIISIRVKGTAIQGSSGIAYDLSGPVTSSNP